MIEVFIPKPYTITGEEELVDDIASPLTYKTAQVGGTYTLSESGYICAFGEGLNLLTDGNTGTVLEGLNAWVSDTEADTVRLNGTVTHMAPCERYELPNLDNKKWTPPAFSQGVEYNNNISELGYFVGRSIVRKGSTVDIDPISFRVSVARLEEMQELRDAMREQPFYVRIPAPDDAIYCFYGWAEREPKLQYDTDYGFITFSFKMRGTL